MTDMPSFRFKHSDWEKQAFGGSSHAQGFEKTNKAEGFDVVYALRLEESFCYK